MTARIYQKIPNTMQRGKANGKGWVLEHDVPYAWRADPLTGWQGSGDTLGQVTLTFPSREAAVAFAEREGLDHYVLETPSSRTVRPRPYAANFQGGEVAAPDPERKS